MIPANPLISVALCTYNGGRFLREQLDSLLAQDYAPLEIVAVDDASSDDTVAILEEYGRRDKRIAVHRNPVNLGFRKNFERTIDLCRGELIATCDQDDIWHPSKLSTLQNAIGQSSLVYCDSELVDETGKSLGRRASCHMNMYSGSDPSTFALFNCVSGHAMLFTKKLVALAMPFPAIGYHDWWLAFVAASTDEVKYVNECLVKYRQHPAAQTDLSKSRPKQPRRHREQDKIDWLIAVSGFKENKLLAELTQEWRLRADRYLTPRLFMILYRHRRTLYFIRKGGPLTFDRAFRYFWGLRTKSLFNPAKYGQATPPG